VHAPNDKCVDAKNSLYEELDCVFNQFPKYHMKIMLGDFIAKVGREDIFKLRVGNDNVDETSNDNGVRVVKFATSKNVAVKENNVRRKIHKYTSTSPDGKRNSRIDHVLIDRRLQSIILDVQCFRKPNCDNDHYLVITKVMEGLSVSKQTTQKFDMQRFGLKKLKDAEVMEQYQVKS
jgi:hypothetical protein